jgi:hypothetical protein
MYSEFVLLVGVALSLIIGLFTMVRWFDHSIVAMPRNEMPLRSGRGLLNSIAKREVGAESKRPNRSPESTIDWSSPSST